MNDKNEDLRADGSRQGVGVNREEIRYHSWINRAHTFSNAEYSAEGGGGTEVLIDGFHRRGPIPTSADDIVGGYGGSPS